ncbi:fasciclin domain-containing protein [Parabacteroides sp. FAFU027]|uniref:fasciclin domain-containing protein n=1 Tax=Parabacteroides sp. FAFU027 TaxID=2922715 RepID=UPI001FAEE7E3|nr:fasciclin domain-containing protein [Parabacteroides sp. FAFU027]
MKKIYYLIATIAILLSSCNTKWDDYFSGSSSTEENMNMTIAEYLNTHSEYSKFNDILTQTGLKTELTKDQQMTVWVANNSSMDASGIQPTDTLRMQYHINHLPFLQTDLKNGLRIRSLNGIYFQITERNDSLFANASQVVKSIRLKDGVIHEISSLMKSRVNIYEYMKNLGNDYSMIRDSIFKYNVEKFDKANSTPIGVDKTGNTVYDSVFYVYNPLFATVQFNSEFEQFTVFLPSNEVINNCFQTLQSTYINMGKTVAKSDSTLAWSWIKQAMFYKGELKDFSSTDINSAFGKIWRTTVQKIDVANPEPMSNGLVYKITKLKIPNNVIISRIKSLVEYWRYQDADKLYPSTEDLYTFKGLSAVPSVFTADATPKPAILPNYIVLQVPGNADSNDEFSVEFPPLEKYFNVEKGDYSVRVMQVPTGEYNLYMGFRSSAHPYVNILFNGKQVGTELQASLSTPWNYDRVTETEKDLNPTNGTAKWDGLGGLVGVVNVTKEDGTSGMASFKIKVKYSRNEASGKKTLMIYHWALKPTANNY